jgi:CRAL/TRIO domain
MVQAQVLHSRERQVMAAPPPSTEGVGYYAHVIALLILFCLWRFPIASAKGLSNDPNKATKGHNRPGLEKCTSDEESTSDDVSVKRKEILDQDEELRHLFPNATAAERKRFQLARIGNIEACKAQLGVYLEWREKHDTIEKQIECAKIESDVDEWNNAAAIAMVSCEEDLPGTRLPRLARIYSIDGSAVRDRDGRRILHVMPGQMDPNLAKPSTYAVALALYIDRQLDRASTECLTVALDVRGGKGWPNIPPLRNLPFIKTVVTLLVAMFPERLHRCLLFPVPQAANWIWNIVKGWIDPDTSCKVQLLTGPATIVSQPPFVAMEKFLEPEVAKLLEEKRHATFIDDTQCVAE